MFPLLLTKGGDYGADDNDHRPDEFGFEPELVGIQTFPRDLKVFGAAFGLSLAPEIVAKESGPYV